jgi:hypothetical protein
MSRLGFPFRNSYVRNGTVTEIQKLALRPPLSEDQLFHGEGQIAGGHVSLRARPRGMSRQGAFASGSNQWQVRPSPLCRRKPKSTQIIGCTRCASAACNLVFITLASIRIWPRANAQAVDRAHGALCGRSKSARTALAPVNNGNSGDIGCGALAPPASMRLNGDILRRWETIAYGSGSSSRLSRFAAAPDQDTAGR